MVYMSGDESEVSLTSHCNRKNHVQYIRVEDVRPKEFSVPQAIRGEKVLFYNTFKIVLCSMANKIRCGNFSS